MILEFILQLVLAKCRELAVELPRDASSIVVRCFAYDALLEAPDEHFPPECARAVFDA